MRAIKGVSTTPPPHITNDESLKTPEQVLTLSLFLTLCREAKCEIWRDQGLANLIKLQRTPLPLFY
jgi:hypothetical protein